MTDEGTCGIDSAVTYLCLIKEYDDGGGMMMIMITSLG
jgi:hypothetical protein